MSYEISKELFEAVMGFCKNEIAEMYVSDENIFWHTYEDEFIGIKDSKINVDTFFFKCKEWALNEGYWLMTWKHKIGAGCKVFRGHLNIRIDERLDADSEQQAVFDACMYILDKDKQ